MAEEKVVKGDVTTGKCDSCGSNLTFDPTSQKLKCDHCGSLFDFPKNNEVVQHTFKDKEPVSKRIEWSQTPREIKCEMCGGTFQIKDFNITGKCPYCNTDYVLKDDSVEGLKFDGVVPFVFDKNECAERYAKNIRKKLFAPSAFKKKQNVENISRIYLPSFVFDNETKTTYSGVLTRTETYRDSKGNTHTRYIDFPIAGVKEISFNDYVMECSNRIVYKDIEPLLPFDFSKGLSYTYDLVRGYNAEQNSDSLEDSYKQAQAQMENTIKTSILSSYPHSGVKYFNMNVDYFNELYRYYLLPFYEMIFKYKDKTYKNYVNGQTGKIGRGYPISPLRVAIAVLLGLAIVAGIVVLIIYGTKK